ncbi:MAG: hypothetical protein A07HN63_01637 [uncultured archaeon A07HN63]|nr:MAG: hypothetical protein A07HN63_01637 [uncultured archaeon A07HN63]
MSASATGSSGTVAATDGGDREDDEETESDGGFEFGAAEQ